MRSPQNSLPKKYWVLGIALMIVIAVRAAAPALILNNLNKYLASFSPMYRIHIADMDLHFIRMAYSFQEAEGTLKKDGFRFMAIDRVDVSLAWRELFRGRIVADIDIKNTDMKLTSASIKALATQDKDKYKDDAQNVKDATVPFDLERLRLMGSSFYFSDMAGLPPEQSLYLSDIESVAHNLTPVDDQALTMFVATGSLQKTAPIKAVGHARLKQKPSDWSVNIEMRNLDLTSINPVAQRIIPLTFKTGRLSVYSAVRSLDGKTEGYVKPFFKDLSIIGDKRDFKNVKQFGLELLGTIAEFLLKNRESQALATKVSFRSVNGKMKIDTGQAVALALDNTLGDPLKPSLDETLDLK